MNRLTNLAKITLTIAVTILANIAVIRERGKWVPGGNVLVPVGCVLLFWLLPKILSEK